jgi:hypothetical protein
MECASAFVGFFSDSAHVELAAIIGIVLGSWRLSVNQANIKLSVLMKIVF